MPTRLLPFCPKTTRELKVGDLIGVPCEPKGWACLQVVELQREGPGSLTSLILGALPWSGSVPPTAEDVQGMQVGEQGLTRIELFTEGHLQVVANSPVNPSRFASNYRDFGIIARHQVWGWKAAIRMARAAAESVASGRGDRSS